VMWGRGNSPSKILGGAVHEDRYVIIRNQIINS